MGAKGIVLLLSLWCIAGLSEAQTATDTSPAPTAFCYVDTRCNEAGNNTFWPGQCKVGKNQSPIDLPRSGKMMLGPLLTHSIQFKGYKSPSFYIMNNGHTIQVQFEATSTSTSELTGWGLKGQYVFGQMHLHWGTSGLRGSEHTIDGKRFDLEIHFVHYAKAYGSISAAAASSDPQALAVYAVLVNVRNETGLKGVVQNIMARLREVDTAFAPIVKNFPQSLTETPIFVNESINLNPLLARIGETFYRYNGSLTTPGCAEVVVWTVNKFPLTMSEIVDERFKDITGDDSEEVPENHRLPQPINGRVIQEAITL